MGSGWVRVSLFVFVCGDEKMGGGWCGWGGEVGGWG